MRKSKDKKIELNFSEKQLFSKILNVYMPKTFDWWKKIVIDDAYIRLYDNMNILVVQSRINVDREWAAESYYEWNGHRVDFDDPEHEVTLGDLYGAKTGEEMRQIIQNLFSSFYPGEYAKEVRFYANVTFDDI